MATDQRVVERDICEIEAKVFFGHRSETFDCLVVDISEEGAKIEIDPATRLPIFFTLALPVTSSITDNRFVELRWRVENMAGLRFVRSRH